MSAFTSLAKRSTIRTALRGGQLNCRLYLPMGDTPYIVTTIKVFRYPAYAGAPYQFTLGLSTDMRSTTTHSLTASEEELCSALLTQAELEAWHPELLV